MLDGGEPVCDSFEGTWLFCCWCSLWGIYPKDFFYHWGLVVGLVVSFLLVFEVVLIERALGVVTSTNSARCAGVEVTLGVRPVDGSRGKLHLL